MRNKIFLACFLAIIGFTLALQSFTAPPPPPLRTANLPFYEYTWTKDTILNALNDTLYLGNRVGQMLADFEVCWSVTRTSISGTVNVAVKVEETNYAYLSSTSPPTAGWAPALNSANAAAATAATTATTENIYIPRTYGINQRIIVDGTGTQLTSYTIRVTLKKKA